MGLSGGICHLSNSLPNTLFIRGATGFWSRRAAHKQHQNHNGQHIGQHGQQLGRHIDRSTAQQNYQSLSKTKKQTGHQRSLGGPLSKNHRCQGDEAMAADHSGGKDGNHRQALCSAAKPSQHTGQDHCDIPDALDIDTQGIRRCRVFPHGTDTQAPFGFVENKPQQRCNTHGKKDGDIHI